MRVDGVGDYRLLGETLDDAAGEAFDKTAKLLGLGYPGGPALAQLAERGTPGRFRLPRPMLASGDLDFSFSGLKTAVLTVVKNAEPETRATSRGGSSMRVVEVLVAKCVAALEATGLRTLVVAGGVGRESAASRGARCGGGARRLPRFLSRARALHGQRRDDRVRAALRLDPGARPRPDFSVKPRWDLTG